MSLISELKRRNVFKVAVAYLALGWVVMQVTDIVVPALNLPPTINSIVVYIGIVGFCFSIGFPCLVRRQSRNRQVLPRSQIRLRSCRLRT